MSATLSGNTGPLGNNAGGGISAAAAAVLTLARLHNSSFLQRQSRSALHTDAIRMPGHLGSVRSVCFSPTVPTLLLSGSYDGTVRLFDVEQQKSIKAIDMPTTSSVKSTTFAQGGSTIVAALNSKTTVVIDAQTAEVKMTYPNTCYTGSERSAIAACPHKQSVLTDGLFDAIVVVSSVNGKGLTYMDLRMARPVKEIGDVHDKTIRDIVQLPPTWANRLGVPYGASGGLPPLATASDDGFIKIIDRDGRVHRSYGVTSCLNSITITPEPYDASPFDFQSSFVGCGNEVVSFRLSPNGLLEDRNVIMAQTPDNGRPLWRVKYTSDGVNMFVACDNGRLKWFKRAKNGAHELFLDSQKHLDDIEDISISCDDQYIAMASQDRTVGLMRIGTPTCGPSSEGAFL